MDDPLEIYIIIKKISKSKYSRVYLVYDRTDKKEYIMKMAGRIESAIHQIKNEIKVLKYLKDNYCKYFLYMHKYFEHDGKTYIISERIKKSKDLYEKLHNVNNNNTINMSNKIKIIKKLIEGLIKLHEIGVYHLDIKPENVLVFKNNGYDIKYIDYGNSYTKNNIDEYSLGGTKYFIDPRLFFTTKITCQILKDADIWSLGILIYELIGEQGIEILYKEDRKTHLIIQESILNKEIKLHAEDKQYDYILDQIFSKNVKLEEIEIK